jgi:hypothetical protein
MTPANTYLLHDNIRITISADGYFLLSQANQKY